MKPFNPGDVVKRIGGDVLNVKFGSLYTIKSDVTNNPNGGSCVELEWHDWFHFDREYFELVTEATKDTLDISSFKVWDIVIRNTDKYEDSFMKKWNAYKITEIFTRGAITVEWNSETYSLCYFNRIKFKFNVWDIVQWMDLWCNSKTWKVHTMSQNWSHFYFEDKNWNKSIFKYKVSDFELVAECKNAHSNNDGCVSDKNWNIDFSNFKPIRLQWTSCPPTLNVGYAWPVGNVGDSIYLNPITPMKTFNEYAVEAFMSNEVNRTNATNALVTLNKLNDDLALAIEATKKVRSVILSDLCKLQTAMSSSDIEVISALIAENAEVKEFVERFMENTLVQILPIPENTNKTVQDKFK